MVESGTRNPWLVALWVVSAVLVAAGALLVALSPAVTTGGVFRVFVLPEVALVLAPWTLGTGLAGLIGAVFVQALRWRG